MLISNGAFEMEIENICMDSILCKLNFPFNARGDFHSIAIQFTAAHYFVLDK